MRIENHPVLGENKKMERVTITVDGKQIVAYSGDTIAAALMAEGIRTFRRTSKTGEPRGVFCAIGRGTDCVMTVDGVPNVRTCVTFVREGMNISTQAGLGQWRNKNEA